MCNNLDNKTIYEIFRACRLCGAGGGYKMPIIPSVVGFDCADIELRQKIRECVQIEVNQDDKMPPLVCELCVDKVNDFYEFLEMCRDTNSKTRQRLGLPLIHAQNLSEGDDCILGVTEPVYAQDDDDEPLSRRSTTRRQIKKEDKRNEKKKESAIVKSLKKELENSIKQENSPRQSRSTRGERHLDSSSSRSSRNRSSPTPVRGTRQSAADNDVSLSQLRDQQKKSDTLTTKIILKREKEEVISIDSDDDNEMLLPSIAKRSKDSTEKDSKDTPNKKIKLTIRLPQPTAAPKARPGPKCSKRADSPPPTKSKDNPRPGPKSSKTIPGPKSSKRTLSPTPGPKSKRSSSPAPGPKSSKRPSSPPSSPLSKLSSSPLAPRSKRTLSPPSSPLSKCSSSPLAPRSKRTLSPVPRSKRNSSPAPKSTRSSSPGPKSKRNSSPAPKSTRSSSPGPKSKRNSSPAPKSTRSSSPGPKSKRNSSPAPKSTRSSSPGPKSKRNSSPAPKSSRSSSPGPKSKRALSSIPGPKSKSLRESPAPGPKSSKRSSSPPKPTPTPEFKCRICASVLTTPQGHANHTKIHKVQFTHNDLACNACGEWFTSPEETTAHHKQHKNRNRPYKCRGCKTDYRTYGDYNKHMSETTCVPWVEAPDVKCDECWREFPTAPILDKHRCGGKEARPGKCSKCSRTYQTLKSLKKHESTCTSKKKASDPWSELKVAPSVRARLRNAQVRIARVDRLLKRNRRHRYDVANVAHDLGVDRSCVYPYFSLVRVKQEPLAFDGMVSIGKDVRDEFYTEEDYVHWDSDNSTSDEEYSLVTPQEKKNKKVPSLTTLSLKTIFSRRCLGKVPRKLRKVRSEKFDTFFNPETEFDVQDDINNIINNLGDENDEKDNGFSMDNIKLTDVKSISDMPMDNDSASIDISDVFRETNESKVVASEEKVDSLNTGEITSEQNSLTDISMVVNTGNDYGSETDASLDDKTETPSTKQVYDEKDTASENSQDTMKTTVSDTIQNGNSLESAVTRIDKNGDTDNQPNLIDEINALYDKKLMEELDVEIGAKDGNMSDKNDKILLEDLVPPKNDLKLGLDAISDEEFNFDA